MSVPMRTKHYNGTAANGTPQQVKFAKMAQRIHVRNIDAANALEVSFDLGTTFYRIPLNGFPLDWTCMVREVWVQGVSGTAAFCIITNEG